MAGIIDMQTHATAGMLSLEEECADAAGGYAALPTITCRLAPAMMHFELNAATTVRTC